MLELTVLHIDALMFTALTQDVMNGLGLYVMVISTDIFLGSAAWIVGDKASESTQFIILAQAGLLVESSQETWACVGKADHQNGSTDLQDCHGVFGIKPSATDDL